MKKLISALTLLVSFLFAAPTFAYTVKSGDTLSQIAMDNNLTLNKLGELNPQVANLDLIYSGQTIVTDPTFSEFQDIQSLTYGQAVQVQKPAPTSNYSASEIDLLARLVRAEAQGESLQGKIAVACVVLNRVESSQFPDSIRAVIYQRGQFQPVQNGAIYRPADEVSRFAVKKALSDGRNLAGKSLFFYNPRIATSHWLDSLATTAVIGNHVFKK
jgi:N-acetylmuramoyl-L-alanine amidase